MNFAIQIFFLLTFAVFCYANVNDTLNLLTDQSNKDVQNTNGDKQIEHQSNDESFNDQRILVGADNQLEKVVPLEMASVGRVADMGELYDGRTDKFLGISIFNQKLKSDSIVTTQNKETKLVYSFANSLEEKFAVMDVSAQLKMSLMMGLIEVEGSAKYFKDVKKSWRSSKATLINSFSTVYETVSVTSVNKDIVDLNVLSKIDATHVVVGIQWGGQIFISVEDANADDKDRSTVQGSLRISVKALAYSISGSGSIKTEENYRRMSERFNFELYGDIVAEEMPQNLVDAVKFMKNAPKLLQQGNGGKGKALKYVLIPVSILRSLWSSSLRMNSLVNSIGEETIKRCVTFYDEMNVMEQKLNDVHSDVLKWDPYIKTSVVNEIKELRHKYSYHQAKVRKTLAEALMQVRSGNKSVVVLENVLMEALKDNYSWPNTEIKMKKFDYIIQEMAFLKMVQSLKVNLLSKYSVLQLFLWENFNKDIFILFYNYHDNEGISFSANFNVTNTFRRMLDYKNYSKSVFAAVNNDVLYTKKNLHFFEQIGTTPKISYFRNGKLLVADFNYEFTQQNQVSDPEQWPNAYMQMQVADLIKAGRFPIGYIYTQLPLQKDPNEVWSGTVWDDVTNVTIKEAGLVCKVEGGKNKLRFWKRME